MLTQKRASIKFVFLFPTTFLFFVSISAPASDEREVVEHFRSGVINWTQGVITAKGSAAPHSPKEGVRYGAIREMPDREAKREALRNLYETIKGMRVDSDMTVENLMSKSERFTIQVQGIVIEATVVDRRYLSDREIEVSVAIKPMNKLLPIILQESSEQESKVKKAVPPQSRVEVEESLDLKKLEYTGLIVDARKLGLRPALLPKIFNQKGELVYSFEDVEEKGLIKMGLVGHTKSMEEAAKNQRVATDPYMISALEASGRNRTDVVISNQDAQVILSTAVYTGFLKKGRVIFVYE